MITVHIWNSNISSGVWGHASMSLEHTYVSWWPSGLHREHNKVISKIYRAGPIRNQTFADDVAGENGLRPDHNIRIQCLDERAIKDWWFRFALLKDGMVFQGPLQDSWETLSKNCSTVVAKGLTTGGGDKLAPKDASNLIWTPNNVLRYAQAIQRAAPGVPR